MLSRGFHVNEVPRKDWTSSPGDRALGSKLINPAGAQGYTPLARPLIHLCVLVQTEDPEQGCDEGESGEGRAEAPPGRGSQAHPWGEVMEGQSPRISRPWFKSPLDGEHRQGLFLGYSSPCLKLQPKTGNIDHNNSSITLFIIKRKRKGTAH